MAVLFLCIYFIGSFTTQSSNFIPGMFMYYVQEKILAKLRLFWRVYEVLYTQE